MIVSSVFWVTAGVSVLFKVSRMFSAGKTFPFVSSPDEIAYLTHFWSERGVEIVVVVAAAEGGKVVMKVC
jgi:hypothetical protein